MARGGGSSRGGRGGSSRPPGLNFDWMKDDALELDFGPTPMFPKMDVKQPPPLSKKEQDQVNHFLAFRKEIHDGPTYAIIGNTSQIERYATFDAAQVDPFEGLPTYSNKYKKKQRTLPDLGGRSYEREYFPKELWSTLKIKPEPRANGTNKGKRARDDEAASDEEGADSAGAKRQRLLDGSGKMGTDDIVVESARAARIRKLIEAEDNEGEDKEGEDSDEEADDSDDEPEDEEEKDDEFDDDDDDDYNAEQYFDDGSDHFEDGGGDDGDGDGDTYG